MAIKSSFQTFSPENANFLENILNVKIIFCLGPSFEIHNLVDFRRLGLYLAFKIFRFFPEIRFETYQLVPYDLQMIPDLENIKETEKGKVQNMYS